MRKLWVGLFVSVGLWAAAAPSRAECSLTPVAQLAVEMEGLSPVTTVKINRMDQKLLVDTGASCSGLAQSIANKLGLKASKMPADAMFVQGVGGSTSFGVVGINVLTVGGYEVVHPDFFVYSDGNLS